MSQRKIKKIISKNCLFLITTHINPDADAISSELVLAGFLKSQGKKVFIINMGNLPKRFRFFPRAKSILKYHDRLKIDYDAAILLDCGDIARIGKVGQLIKKDKPIINIDHHISNEQFADFNLVNPKASSTAEVLYDFLKKSRYSFTKQSAMLLYLGIMTDTGSFRYESTSAHTHEVISELMKFKFSVADLYRKIYEIIDIKDLQSFMKVVQNFELYFNSRVVCVVLRKKTLAIFSQSFPLRQALMESHFSRN